jgi:hypothetical protein
MVSQIKRDSDFVLADVTTHNGMQCTWDYEADYRFAIYAGDKIAIETLTKIFKSNAPAPFIIFFHDVSCRKIKSRRLRALRYLKKAGFLRSVWSGFFMMGDLIRVNNYYLLEK